MRRKVAKLQAQSKRILQVDSGDAGLTAPTGNSEQVERKMKILADAW